MTVSSHTFTTSPAVPSCGRAESTAVADRSRAINMPAAHSICEACGEPARVHLLTGYRAGQPVRHALCTTCALTDSLHRPAPSPRRRRVPLSTIAAGIGAVLTIAIASADYLLPTMHVGFGWLQCVGAVIGFALVGIGVMTRGDLLIFGGGLLTVAALLADFVAGGTAPGFGWKQQMALALLCGACGGLYLLHRILKRHLTRRAALEG